MPRFVPSLVLLTLALPARGGAQVGPVSALWREWTTLEAEWRAERAVFAQDLERNRAIRTAVAAGRDPRAVAPRAAPRPAGPRISPRPAEVSR